MTGQGRTDTGMHAYSMGVTYQNRDGMYAYPAMDTKLWYLLL